MARAAEARGDVIWYGGDDYIFGGASYDQINGGAGRDSFWITTAPDGDAITDFNRTEGDRILLSKAAFTAFAATDKLAGAAFHSGAGVDAAHDATDRILNNTTTGELGYDADGTGATAAQLIATLGGHEPSAPLLRGYPDRRVRQASGLQLTARGCGLPGNAGLIAYLARWHAAPADADC